MWPSKVPIHERDNWKFWTNFWDGPETIVFGHSVFDRPLITRNVVGIDGGSVFGRQLHAYILPEGRIVSINAHSNYGHGKRGRGNDSISS